ncbi:MAG: hypothetical protein JXC32_03880, partial [Anaerolineae bacterium]|nr:hypothetical protein [Anaerolineae bacterium]
MRRSIVSFAILLFTVVAALLVLATPDVLSYAPRAPAAPAQAAVIDIPPIQMTPDIEGDCAEYVGLAFTDTFTYADGSTATIY